jgi:hypothetical protein
VQALSIKAPWLWAIVAGHKTIENRSQVTHVRGRVLLHASKGCTAREYGDAAAFMFDRCGIASVPELDALPRGAIVAAADIVDCVTASSSPWFVGEYGWVLANVVALTAPIPCSGKLGFWRVPDEVAAQVRKAAAQSRGAA